MNVRFLFSVVLLLGLAACTGAAEPTPADLAAAAGVVSPSLVRVEFTLRYDKGEAPRAGGWMHMGVSEHGREGFESEQSINEERPMEVGGFLVDSTLVVAPDPLIHPRFVESIAVRFGNDIVKAKVFAYPKNQSAVILKLERPLENAKPLVFDAKRPGPYLAVTYGFSDGAWNVGVDAMPTGLIVEQPDLKFAPATIGTLVIDNKSGATILTAKVEQPKRLFAPAVLDALVVDKTGAAVALTMVEEIPADDSWKGSPLSWPAYSEADLKTFLADVEQRAAAGILRVTLFFRSPSKGASRAMRFRGEEDSSATEEHGAGVLVGGNRLLVIAGLKPKITARLERILVYPPKGDPVPARFTCSLTDYGALVATLEKPLDGAPSLSAMAVLDTRNTLLPAAELMIRGEECTRYFQYTRVEEYSIGWRRQVYPIIPGSAYEQFVFDPQGALLAIPIAQREKVSLEERYSHTSPRLTPMAYLKPVLDNLQANSDANNVPVTEEEESRLAWLGVELQPLGQELARANKVSELTQDGNTGGLVTYVYPNSPAAKEGIEAGFILLRLRVEGLPKPLEIEVGRDVADREFPWEELDEVPERYFDRIPTPWPSAENTFTRALTDLGFNKKFTAEFFHDGKVITKDFAVAQSPPHYEAAPRYKAPALGVTVRDLTYEVRRYFNKTDKEPGVIISKVEPGGKASVAGIKPYEIITHVNDEPVMNVKDFEKYAAAAKDEVRLAVKRMNQGRVVKIKMNGPVSAKPADTEEGETAKPAAPAPKAAP